jgi:hypothetical protein
MSIIHIPGFLVQSYDVGAFDPSLNRSFASSGGDPASVLG